MTKPRDQHEPTTPNDAEQATPADPGFSSGPVREAVGIFDGNADLLAAIDELLMSGFARCELSLLGTDEAAMVRRTAEALADDPAAPRTDHFCVEALGNAEGSLISGLAIVPAFGAAWAGAAAGAGALAVGGFVVVSGGVGALVGVALAALLARHHSGHLAAQVEDGGLLLWVRTRSPELEWRALDILARHAAHHVHAHELPH